MFICFLEYQREERFIYSPRPGKFPFEAVCFLALITQELPRACGDFLWFLGADFFFFFPLNASTDLLITGQVLHCFS
jgi:hypothetical protein